MKAIYLKYGGVFYYIGVKGEDNNSYKTCIGDTFRNFVKWKNIVLNAEKGDEIYNLRVKSKNLIDADSNPQLKKIKNETDILSTR